MEKGRKREGGEERRGGEGKGEGERREGEEEGRGRGGEEEEVHNYNVLSQCLSVFAVM